MRIHPVKILGLSTILWYIEEFNILSADDAGHITTEQFNVPLINEEFVKAIGLLDNLSSRWCFNLVGISEHTTTQELNALR